jgi:hypothetical protein
MMWPPPRRADMKWWQIRKRDADLERELRSDLELEEEEQREGGISVLIHPDWRVFSYLAVLVVAATIVSSLMVIRNELHLRDRSLLPENALFASSDPGLVVNRRVTHQQQIANHLPV